VRSAIKSVLRAIRPHRKLIALIVLPVVLLGVNVPPAIAFVKQMQHQWLIDSPEYEAQFGRWDVINLPDDLQVNAIHTALLPTGKLLIIAGSGNEQKQFDAGTFRSLIYDPATGQSRLIPTPADMFCGGHAFLPDGKLLVAGGTQRYELLPPAVVKAAGAMTVKNESPDQGHTLDKGTEFVSPDGKKYRSTNAVTLPPAAKVQVEGKKKGVITVQAAQTTVFVESEVEGPAGVTTTPAQYSISGLSGVDANNLYGLAQQMTLDKQDFQGIADSYEFDPNTEQYVKVGDMNEKRWYPSLLGLPNGNVLAVSGLDGVGQILPGQNEVYDPATKKWTDRPDLFQYFPTYPALFQTAKPGELFYSGSNAGYGPADKGREPGFWNLDTNTLTPVKGLRDPELMETSGSTFLGPVQDQRIAVVGGGGVGESPLSTKRIDIIDLKDPNPEFKPGPDLPEPNRYPNLTTLPDDTTLISNGSKDYRGKGASWNYSAEILSPDGKITPAAESTVGRDYHSESVLLPNGQVLTLGGNALFKDEANLKPAVFEKRLEMFTPAYLFKGKQPVISDAPAQVKLGDTMSVTADDPTRIAKARLVKPTASTHVTNLDQRSVALDMTKDGDGSLKLAVPKEDTIVQPGFYMLFLVDDTGVPSVARWVQVT
jgi:hypothetical protein